MRQRLQLVGERGGRLGGLEARRMGQHQRHQAMFGRVERLVVTLLDLPGAIGGGLHRRPLAVHLAERGMSWPGRAEPPVDAVELTRREIQPHARRRVHAGRGREIAQLRR